LGQQCKQEWKIRKRALKRELSWLDAIENSGARDSEEGRVREGSGICLIPAIHTCRPVDGTSMNKECEAVMVDHQVCAVRFLT